MTISLTQALLASALSIPASRAQLWASTMQPALQLADISTPQRLACWLAQVGHETGRLRYVREIWGPTAAQQRYEPVTTLSRRLGNTQPGDGRRYLGRGLIQTTGRANYARLTDRVRQLMGDSAPDFVATPALVEVPQWAAIAAAVYWRDRDLNRWADAFDFVTLTKRINGGTNGLADRQHLYTQALSAITLGG